MRRMGAADPLMTLFHFIALHQLDDLMEEGGYSSEEGVGIRVKGPYSRKSSTAMSKEIMSRRGSQLELLQDTGEKQEGAAGPSPPAGGKIRRKSWLENAVADIKALSFRSVSHQKSAVIRKVSDVDNKSKECDSSAADSSRESLQVARNFRRRKSASHKEEKAYSHSEKLPVLRPLLVHQASKVSSMESGPSSPIIAVNDGGVPIRRSRSSMDPSSPIIAVNDGGVPIRHSRSSMDPSFPSKQQSDNSFHEGSDAKLPSPALPRAATARRRRMSVPFAPIYDPVTGEAIENTILVLEAVEDVTPPTAAKAAAAFGGPPEHTSADPALPHGVSTDLASAGLRRGDTATSMSSVLSVTAMEEVTRRENQALVLRILDRVKGCNVGRAKRSKDEKQAQSLLKEPNDPVSRPPLKKRQNIYFHHRGFVNQNIFISLDSTIVILCLNLTLVFETHTCV